MIPNLPAPTIEPKLAETQPGGGNALEVPVQKGEFQKTMQVAQSRLRDEGETAADIPSPQMLVELAAPIIALNTEPIPNPLPLLIEASDMTAFEDVNLEIDPMNTTERKPEIPQLPTPDFFSPPKSQAEPRITPMVPLPSKLETAVANPTISMPQIPVSETPKAMVNTTMMNSEIRMPPLQNNSEMEIPTSNGATPFGIPLDAKVAPAAKISTETIAPHVWQALSEATPQQDFAEDVESTTDSNSPDLEIAEKPIIPHFNARHGQQEFGSKQEALERQWDFTSIQDSLKTDAPQKSDFQKLELRNTELPMRVALPQLSSVLLQQISARVTNWSMNHREELVVQVDPPNLGKVQVELQMHQGQVSARIHVENENVRQLLENQLPTLKQSMEQQGMRLESLQVSVQDKHASLMNPDGQNTESFFQRRGSHGHSHSGMESELELDPNSEEDTGQRWGLNTVEFVG